MEKESLYHPHGVALNEAGHDTGAVSVRQPVHVSSFSSGVRAAQATPRGLSHRRFHARKLSPVGLRAIRQLRFESRAFDALPVFISSDSVQILRLGSISFRKKELS